MGGAYRVPGNTAPTTEWNIHCDPDAAKIAFTAWARRRPTDVPRPLALGLDVTEKAKILPDHIVALARRAGSTPDDSIALTRGEDPMHATARSPAIPIVRFVADALRFYMEFHSRYDGFYGAFIHDPLAVAAALDPTLVRTEALTVDVELGGTLTTGETVTDWRRVWSRPPNVDVAVEADADAFLDGSSSGSAGWQRSATAQTRAGGKEVGSGLRAARWTEDQGMSQSWVRAIVGIVAFFIVLSSADHRRAAGPRRRTRTPASRSASTRSSRSSASP